MGLCSISPGCLSCASRRLYWKVWCPGPTQAREEALSKLWQICPTTAAREGSWTRFTFLLPSYFSRQKFPICIFANCKYIFEMLQDTQRTRPSESAGLTSAEFVARSLLKTRLQEIIKILLMRRRLWRRLRCWGRTRVGGCTRSCSTWPSSTWSSLLLLRWTLRRAGDHAFDADYQPLMVNDHWSYR